ncbi:mannose-1-phosphate guanylyltransferase [Niallia circulans]|uniref:sugar phosphate nucleotidyltransferase n=1 Tax=Niallia circulans TaxID=1397 RepID=UPI00201DA752|nr:sugar phosphate nucleotidyltransferase [Niallia circulans]UQZ75706.1 mannose-1-phosphate guanylyltransferase [Niallia circulans]
MKLILLSGGSGKRLWPLSNDTRSKQFLKVLDNNLNEKVSMVQRVWNQLTEVKLKNDTVIATSKIQSEMIHSQIGTDITIITEPERRDTFPAIALAATYLHTLGSISEDEVIVVLPVDPYVENNFFLKLKELEQLLNKSNSDLALIGVKPTYPSSKYGYIVPIKETGEHLEVSHFIEKPAEEDAEKLIRENALWNCGVFGFKLSYLLGLLREKKIPLDYYDLLKDYSSLPKISFDYEVVERAKHIVALQYEGYWKDLGTWNTLTEEMTTSLVGKGIISEECNNTHLINELDIPITVLGTSNLIVAASPDGILVSDKASSPKIKDLIKEFDHPPMYEERIWGWSRTLDYSKYDDGEEMVTKRICILKDRNSTYHYHKLRDEVWTIVKGEGELILDNNITRVKAGDVVHLPAGKKHGVRAILELEFIEVQTGSEISNQDVHRLAFEWKEILAHFKRSKSSVIL